VRVAAQVAENPPHAPDLVRCTRMPTPTLCATAGSPSHSHCLRACAVAWECPPVATRSAIRSGSARGIAELSTAAASVAPARLSRAARSPSADLGGTLAPVFRAADRLPKPWILDWFRPFRLRAPHTKPAASLGHSAGCEQNSAPPPGRGCVELSPCRPGATALGGESGSQPAALAGRPAQ